MSATEETEGAIIQTTHAERKAVTIPRTANVGPAIAVDNAGLTNALLGVAAG